MGACGVEAEGKHDSRGLARAAQTLVKRTRRDATFTLERRRASKPARGEDLAAAAAAAKART